MGQEMLREYLTTVLLVAFVVVVLALTCVCHVLGVPVRCPGLDRTIHRIHVRRQSTLTAGRTDIQRERDRETKIKINSQLSLGNIYNTVTPSHIITKPCNAKNWAKKRVPHPDGHGAEFTDQLRHANKANWIENNWEREWEWERAKERERHEHKVKWKTWLSIVINWGYALAQRSPSWKCSRASLKTFDVCKTKLYSTKTTVTHNIVAGMIL